MVLMNKKAMMKLAFMLFLLGFTATVADARFDSTSFITQLLFNDGAGYSIKSTTTACCNSCPCTRSIPPQCRCTDVGETCHSACKSCLCTRSLPPKCRCTDTTNFCYKNCN
ncbi:Bowman-Birk type wound-induced trypsin inhibitor-like [Vicia villosa]|uniref:Bowman-Birk type wound-induced trypsin inhibitor-like n=1 Tax=Vicia villosa TaxID=3911 RepID=UPI00273AB2DE|nr:Bowman-Birk type wound-induced trypsin inhibitor-like [Vicia villosa]